MKTILFTLFVTLLTAYAKAEVKVKDGWYYIKNPDFNKYLQVLDGFAYDAANVVIGSGRKDDAQRWYVTNRDDGFITLKSALGDYNLDINRNSDANNANVQIYQALGGNAQRFLLEETDQENVYIILTNSSHGEKAIDIERKKNAENQNVLQWTNERKSNQFWYFEWDEENNPKEPEKKPEPEKPVDSGCWSEVYGFKCCTGCAIYLKDDKGNWGIENDQWCGVQPSCKSLYDECWSETYGFRCCEGCNVYTKDQYGEWGIENDHWCGISPSCKN